MYTDINRLPTALDHAKRGWRVFPVHEAHSGRCSCDNPNCKSPGKHPRIRRWQRKATTDPVTIAEWWGRWPGANVGIATGEGSNLLVLDIDPRHGGYDALDQLEAQHGPLPVTVAVLTGGGGEHRYLAYPEGASVRSSTSKVGSGLDVKGEGGFVIGAGSIHESGNFYEWDEQGHPDDVSVAVPPRWLLDAMRTSHGRAPEGARVGDGAIPVGKRNSTLTSLAGTMRRRGMGVEAISAALREQNRLCHPPLTEAEVARIAASVAGYEPTDPILSRAVAAGELDNGLPTILVGGRRLRDVTEDAVRALTQANEPDPQVFVRGGDLTIVQVDELGRTGIRVLGRAGVRGRLARAADFVRHKGQEQIDVPPPLDVVDDVMALGSWQLPALEGIIATPTLRPDGSLLMSPGYDPDTRLYYSPQEGFDLPAVPEAPVAEQVAEALVLIDEAISEFPYDSTASRANALAMLLTPIVRPAIHGHVPLAAIDATSPGTGKTLLANVVAAVAAGVLPAVMSECGSEDEWDKVITSLLLQGAGVITIDNIDSELKSGRLAAALTSAVWRARILGRSQMTELSQRAVWLATGNNIRLGGDLARRCYWIRLDAKVSRPWQRTGFRHPDLVPWVLEHRAETVAALLTLARAWYAAGQPEPGVRPLGSFEEWTRIVGGILEHAGIKGFLGNLDEMYERADGDATSWEAFIAAVYEAYGGKSFTTRDLASRLRYEDSWAETAGDLRAALPDELAEDITMPGNRFQLRLGKALQAKQDRRYGPEGLTVLRGRGDTHSKVATWRVAKAALAGDAGDCGGGDSRRHKVHLLPSSGCSAPRHTPHPPRSRDPGREAA